MKTSKKLMKQREDEWKEWYDSNCGNWVWKNQGQVINTKEAWLEGAKRERERMLIPPSDPKKREIKKMKLGFKSDAPTCTGRIYSRSVLENAFARTRKNSEILIRESCTSVIDNYMVPIKEVIGMCKDFEIKENGDVFIHAIPINDYPLEDFKLLTHGHGNINRDNQVEDFHLTCFYLLGPEDYLAGD